MKNFPVTMIVSAILTVMASSAGAACGGGGWHTVSTSNGTAAPAVSTRSEIAHSLPQAQNTSYERSADSPHGYLNTSQFDARSARLGLSQQQWNDVSDAKEDIRNETEKLVNAMAKAQAKLDRCEGDCRDEQRRLTRASDAVNRYDATREFEQKLNGILTSDQLNKYRSSAAGK